MLKEHIQELNMPSPLQNRKRLDLLEKCVIKIKAIKFFFNVTKKKTVVEKAICYTQQKSIGKKRNEGI